MQLQSEIVCLTLFSASQHVRTLFHLVLTNGEFRKLISDFGVVARDLASRGAIKVAEGVRPDQERLRAVDEGTRQDHFVEDTSHSSIPQAGSDATRPTSSSRTGGPAATGQSEAAQKGKAEAAGVKDQAKDAARDLRERDDADADDAKGKVQGLFNRVKVSL